jgi:hypothetical protein
VCTQHGVALRCVVAVVDKQLLHAGRCLAISRSPWQDGVKVDV